LEESGALPCQVRAAICLAAKEQMRIETFTLADPGSFGAKRQDVARFIDMFVAGDYSLDEIVSHRRAFEEINQGFAMMTSGESIRSVIVFELGAGTHAAQVLDQRF
jgi:S-(hydroxymethyl)glutathione dehydrogenase/alcohol dehydrogenase